MMQVTRAAFQAVASLNQQATDPKSHTLVRNFILVSFCSRYLLIPMVDPNGSQHTGVWARGILATEYGVDLDKITWVVVDEEHVQEYRKPANVMERPKANLAEMLVAGELAAAIGVGKVDSPDVKALIPDPAAAEAAWYRKTGIYPPHSSGQRRATPVRSLAGPPSVCRLRGRQNAIPERA
jgi:hypothetical protein